MLPYFIGYGGLAPSTSTGRVFCMIYALVGIPFCLVFISALGRQFFNASQRLCIKSSCCRHRKWLPLLIYILLRSVLFIWMAAAMFGFIEDWAYRDAVYYTFITPSTIGFGDLCLVGDVNISITSEWSEILLVSWKLPFHWRTSPKFRSSGSRVTKNSLFEFFILHGSYSSHTC